MEIHELSEIQRLRTGNLSYTGLKWRKTKEPLLFRLGLAKLVLCLLCSFVSWTLIISYPVDKRPALGTGN